MVTKGKLYGKKTLARLLSALMITTLIFSSMPMLAFAASANKDSFTKNTIPSTMVAGQTYTVKITVKNTGSTTWTVRAGYQLVAVGGSDPFTKCKSIVLDPIDSIKPNGTKTFTVTLTAPLKNAKLTTDWQMAKGTTKFGKVLTKVVTVSVAEQNSALISCTMPAKIKAGSKITATVVFRNTGSKKWTGAAGYKMVVSMSVMGESIPVTTIPLSKLESVPTGSVRTFKMSIDAPMIEGSLTFTYQMACGSTGFGDISAKTFSLFMTDAQKLEQATEEVEDAESSLSQDDLDMARMDVDALPNSAAKAALEARLDDVQQMVDALNDYTTMLTNAKAKVAKAEKTHLQSDVDAAQALVTALPASSLKSQLQARLDAVQADINLSNATAAVVKAETSKTQADVTAARTLVNALPNSTAKSGLVSRLDAVQAVIDLAAAKTTAHADLATAFSGYNQANYTADNWTVLTTAKATGDTAIDAATTIAAVGSAKNAAIAAMQAATPNP